MLKKIYIENFLTIEKCVIEPSSAITAITGESGSGKSLILKAVDLVFSQKTPSSVIGNFSETAKISLLFKVNEYQKTLLDEFGVVGDEILLTKIIKQGMAKLLVNHEPISARLVASMKDDFLSTVSQDYRFEIFSQKRFIDVLDSRIDKAVRDEFLREWKSYLKLEREIEAVKKRFEEINKLHPEILLEAIEKVNPKMGEYEELLETLKKIKNYAVFKDMINKAVYELYEKEDSIEDRLSRLVGSFDRVSESFEKLEARSYLENALESIRLARDELYGVSNRDFSHDDIDRINARLFQLEKLKRQFAMEIDEIIKHRESLKTLIAEKERLSDRYEKLQDELIERKQKLLKKANLLSEERKKVAKEITLLVLNYLGKLNMEKSILNINFKEKEITDTGLDYVEILFSANPDLSANTIDKVASGGERSRFILALKMALSELANIHETVIFDEIETGLSLSALDKLLSLLVEYSKNNQIILITHSDKMLSIANSVYKVTKKYTENLTRSMVEKLG